MHMYNTTTVVTEQLDSYINHHDNCTNFNPAWQLCGSQVELDRNNYNIISGIFSYITHQLSIPIIVRINLMRQAGSATGTTHACTIDYKTSLHAGKDLCKK